MIKQIPRRPRARQLIIFLYMASAAQGPIKPAIVLETAPYFDKPQRGLLPKGFIEKRDTCQTDSTAMDSTGNPWMRIAYTGKRYWVSAKNIRFLSDMTPDFMPRQMKGDEDKKRRLQILQANRQWPHRVKMAVRDGQICLGMTEEQLIASWGQPLQSGAIFTVGVGRHDYRLFRDASENYLIVTMQDGIVAGWSEDH